MPAVGVGAEEKFRQNAWGSGGGPPETFRILKEDGSGYILFENADFWKKEEAP